MSENIPTNIKAITRQDMTLYHNKPLKSPSKTRAIGSDPTIRLAKIIVACHTPKLATTK